METFGGGISSHILTVRSYTLENLGSILKQFFDDNTADAKDMRFNFFIDQRINNYLKWVSMNTGKTKAQIVRELLQDEIAKDKF